MANPIYQLRQQDENGNWTGEDYKFSADASNVNCTYNGTSFSLQNFIDEIMANAQFTYTGSTKPTSSNVKVWYQTN